MRTSNYFEKNNFFSVGFLFLSFLLVLASSGINTGVADTNNTKAFGVEQRIACQTIIEDIRWSHRIWPSENKTPKPARTEIVSDAQIRSKVENNLKMEAVLNAVYDVSIDATMLQAELDRMARTTKAPARLQELFDALGNDPITIAECLARPTLVKRKLYNRYAWDDRQHDALKKRAQATLATLNESHALADTSARENKWVLTRKSEEKERESDTHDNEGMPQRIELDNEAFEQEARRLTRGLKKQAQVTSTSLLRLRETETAFVYEKLQSRTADRLEVYSLAWQKQDFNSWLASQNSQSRNMPHEEAGNKLRLPVISGDVETTTAYLQGALTTPLSGRVAR